MTSELRAWNNWGSKMTSCKCQSQTPEPSIGKKSSFRHRRSQSAPHDGLHGHILDLLPQAPTNLKLNWEQVSMNIDGNGKQTSCNLKNLLDQEFTAELIKEIAVLELEVMNLEQYLLSLYRTAFNRQIVTLPFSDINQGSMSRLAIQMGSLLPESKNQISQHTDFAFRPHQPSLQDDSCAENIKLQRDYSTPPSQISVSPGSAGSDKQNFPTSREKSKSVSTCLSDNISLMKDAETAGLGLHSLADHLGASISKHIPDSPDRLSENVVRCMASIYCKLANPPLPNLGLSASPNSSLSTSTFSPQDHCDNWSPRCTNEPTVNPCQTDDLKEICGPYSAMVEVPWLCVDEDRLSYAARMLQNFRSLVQRLEKVDPGRMKYEEKLSFWINIHNALVMHAYLAYGIPQNNMKRASLLLKATYNVGGHSINASVIQSSILGCRSYRPALWLRTLFLPGTKFRGGIDRHIYALEHPEPLLHFALSSGGHSDPAVRVYTAKRIFQELEVAKEEYIQATVGIRKEVKITLPKIMDYFAKDASLNLSELLEMILGCVTETKQKAIERCLEGKPHKSIEWIPYNSSFRYIIQRELAKA